MSRKKKMKPVINKVCTPRYTPPFVVQWYDRDSNTWLTWSSHTTFGPAVRVAKTRVACGFDARIVDAGGSQLWRAAPDAVRGRHHDKTREEQQ